MPRWEPNARARLEAAALELFTEHGYRPVTVAQITERAGLTKASYFRHFADKREVLFWGQDRLVDLVRTSLAEAPKSAGPRELADLALDALAALFTPDRHSRAAVRQRIIDSEPELHERLVAKRAAIADAVAAALERRGLDAGTARVTGHLTQLAFTTAHARWAASADGTGFAAQAHAALEAALVAAARLSGEDRSAARLSGEAPQ
jgi:AcrR family transcriptional regulator